MLSISMNRAAGFPGAISTIGSRRKPASKPTSRAMRATGGCSITSTTDGLMPPPLHPGDSPSRRAGPKESRGRAGVCRPGSAAAASSSPPGPSGANKKTRKPLGFRANLLEGVRRALLPMHPLGALALAGCVLPDATLRGRRMFRSCGATVPAVASQDVLSEAFSPGSALPCRERRA